MSVSKSQVKLALTLLVSLNVLCGCAHQYLLSLDDGDQILARSKPKRQDHLYQFVGEDGVPHVIAQKRVVKIRAVSPVEAPNSPPPAAHPKKPRHWYFLWLG